MMDNLNLAGRNEAMDVDENETGQQSLSTETDSERTITDGVESSPSSREGKAQVMLSTSSQDHVFAVPAAPAAKLSSKNVGISQKGLPIRKRKHLPLGNPTTPEARLGISEDMSLHEHMCNYYRWNVVHRESLLTSEDVTTYLTDFTSRTKGKNYYTRNMDEVNQYIAQKVHGKAIQKYLAGSLKTYESSRTLYLSKCKCPRARVPPTVGSTTSASVACHTDRESQASIETSVFGSRLSESESDDDDK